MLALALIAFAITSVQGTAAPSLFDYDAGLPLDVRETGRRENGGAVLRDITYASLTGGANAATLITPQGHALSEESTRERLAWLRKTLRLESRD